MLCKQMVDICKDHPHACGDKPFLFSINSSKIGSSPRVWGQVTVYTCHTLKVRIIPTRVGTRNVLTDKTVSKQDHPHACGDKCHCFEVLPLVSGSSPRVWGQDYIWHCINNGKQDHPHACGDKKKLLPTGRRHLGSSPRVWGQVCRMCRLVPLSRIIPTRVGTRTEITVMLTELEDHPHACGDKKNKWKRYFLSIGSSPRVWGQVFFKSFKHHLTGIIPTRVGTRGL